MPFSPSSDGTVLIGGTADNLNWLPAGVTPVALSATSGDPVNSSSSTTAFMMRVSSDYQTILNVVTIPDVVDVLRIRVTNVPGQTTGAIYFSGSRDGATPSDQTGYYIARLNDNFVNGVPTAMSWYRTIRSQNRSGGANALRLYSGSEPTQRRFQPWDVDGEGKVVYGYGQDFSFDRSEMAGFNADGTDRLIPGWQRHTLVNGSTIFLSPATNYTNTTGNPMLDLSYSGAWLKYAGTGGKARFKSFTQSQYDTLMEDENGNPGRKGFYPLDYFFAAPEPLNENSNNGDAPGYTGYRIQTGGGNWTARIAAITLNKVTGAMVISASLASVPAVNPFGTTDAEPFIFTMDSLGRPLWWARLYQETADNSPIQQHVDQLEIDYANNQVVVAARSRGNVQYNFWKGNELKKKPGGNGFQNALTGNIINDDNAADYSWLGKYGLSDGKIYHSTYVAEYAPNASLAGGASAANLDGFANPNSGNFNLANTYITGLSVSPSGQICILGKAGFRDNNAINTGARIITSDNAFQKTPKTTDDCNSTGASSFVRVYSSSLDSLVYSSLITGDWIKANPSAPGTNNTDLFGAYTTDTSVFVAGYHFGGPPQFGVPTTNIPAWGTGMLQGGNDGIFAELNFSCEPPNQPQAITKNSTAPHCAGITQTYSIPAVPGATSYRWSILGTGWTGTSTTTSITITAPATSNGATLVVRAENACGNSLERCYPLPTYNSLVLPISPNINRPAFHCTSTSAIYRVNAVPGVTQYNWVIVGAGWSVASATTDSNKVSITAGTGPAVLTVTGQSGCSAGTTPPAIFTLNPTTKPATPTLVNATTGFCRNLAKSITINGVAGATSYEWILPSGWSAPATVGVDTVLSVTPGPAAMAGVLKVVAKNSCSTSDTLNVNLQAPLNKTRPGSPGVISGYPAVCYNTTEVYRVPFDANVTNYIWTVSGNDWFSNNSNSDTLEVSIPGSSASTSSTVTVQAINECGAGSVSVIILREDAPDRTGGVGPNISPCIGDSLIYSADPALGATEYSWTFSGSDWSPVSNATPPFVTTTPSITMYPQSGATSGTLTPLPGNKCGLSSRSRSVNLPAPSSNSVSIAVTQPNVLQCTNDAAVYTVAATGGSIGNVTEYLWTLPSGWSVNDASSDGVDFDTVVIYPSPTAVAGLAVVRAIGACGQATFVLTPPSAPAKRVVTGPTSLCGGSTATYTTGTPVPGALYNWAIEPAAAGTILNSGFTATIQWSSSYNGAAYVRTRVGNACGFSAFF